MKKASRKTVKKVARKTAKRVAKGRGVSRIGANTKSTTKRKTAKRKAASGYKASRSGILVPKDTSQPVKATKLKAGFAKAKQEINSLAEEIITGMNQEYQIKEIELSASFSADGKFLGIGVGGATSITIKIAPKND